MKSAAQEIDFNNSVYHLMVDCAEYYFKKEKIAKALDFCQRAAYYAVFNYCGFYSELRLEYLLIEIRNHIITTKVATDTTSRAANTLRILHYATEVSEVGGHTRLLENWIRNDSGNAHDVVITANIAGIPQSLREVVSRVNGTVVTMDSPDMIANARALQAMWGAYDMVVLHHHPHDVLPIMAFGEDSGIPVAVLNHGEHRYWLGVTICDVLIESRESMMEADRKNRFMDQFALLPIPIQKQEYTGDDYLASRRKLGIADEEVLMLSIGSKYKYVPIVGKNFFVDATEVLELNPNAKLVIVGISPEDELAGLYSHPRMLFVAPTKFLDDYRRACDIYIEGYPFSSFTAYMEVGRLGKPVHRMYQAPFLNKYELRNYPNKIMYYPGKHEWVEGLSELIQNPRIRLAAGVAEKENMLIHSAPSWLEYLGQFYDKIRHAPHTIKRKKSKYQKIITGENEIYLHKIQGASAIDIVIKETFDLSVALKMKIVGLGLHKIINPDVMSVRYIFWYLFKAR